MPLPTPIASKPLIKQRRRDALQVEQVVDSLGLGRAQLIVLASGGIVSFNRGVQMCLMSALTLPAKNMFNLGPGQEGLLSTCLFLGMLVGTGVSGHMGDKLGRRVPVCISGALVPILGAMSAISASYYLLLIIRFTLGFVLAFGDVPFCALLSEMTPRKWRVPMRCASESLFDVGYTFAALLSAFQDPFLKHISWTTLALCASLPAGIFAVTTIAWLPESPVFLASGGKHEEAKAVLTNIKRLNNKPDSSVDYEQPPRDRDALGSIQQLRIVFGRPYRKITGILAYSSFVISFFYYGGLYTQPQVMKEGHGMAPGWEIVMGGPADLIGVFLAAVVSAWFPRKVVLSFALFAAAVGITCYGVAGSRNSNMWIIELLYHFGTMSFFWVPAMTFIVLGQLSVEVYPTVAASTGGSVAFGAGRLGALVAPLVFEEVRALVGKWEWFCYIAGSGCLVASLLFSVAWLPLRKQEDFYEDAWDISTPLTAQEEGGAQQKSYM